MPFPRVIPHSDGVGVIDKVGEGVAATRLGERVWVYGAQSYRPFGTAAEYVAVPDALAVSLPRDGFRRARRMSWHPGDHGTPSGFRGRAGRWGDRVGPWGARRGRCPRRADRLVGRCEGHRH